MNGTKVPQIVLKLPRGIALLILFVQHVLQAMTNNPWFVSLAALLTQTAADLAALQAAQATALSRAKGAAAARNDKKKVVIDDLLLLKNGVQTVVNQNPGQAATIIESAGMVRLYRRSIGRTPAGPQFDRRRRLEEEIGRGGQHGRSRSTASSANAVAQLVELPVDEGDRTRVEAHDGGHGHERIRQVVKYAGVALALFDVGLDGVEDGEDLALAIRVEPLHGAPDRLDDRDGVGVVHE
jgi:hypothetical protein